MSFARKHVTSILTSALLITASVSFGGCSSDQNITVKPEDYSTAVTDTPVTTAPEITEPAVTESEVKLPDISTVRVRPEETEDAKYSSLSDFESCFTVKDGYYQLCFLEDKEFEDRINSDIKDAVNKLKSDRGEDDYSYEASRSHSKNVIDAGGIMADIIIRNGFLSVMLEYGYYEPYGTELAGSYSNLLKDKNTIYFDYAVTLNYELTTQAKINSISEMFFDDADWSQDITSAVYKEYHGNPSFLPEGEPELFTLDYILVPTEDGDYAAVRYNSSDLNLSYCGDMIASHYRSMAGISSLTSDSNYEMYTQSSIETCSNCGMNYIHLRFDTSRFYGDDELASMNSELETLYDHGFMGRENHECFSLRSNYGTVRQYNPESNKRNCGLNLWSYSDKENKVNFFDPYSYERLGIEQVIGWNWRDHAASDDPETPDISTFEAKGFVSVVYKQSEGIVTAVLTGYSPTYQHDITVTANVPADEVNENYLAG